ncbi:MAG TPA: hypothetical protein VMT95_02805 [Candidatus Binatia bacterium]|nr:hypothetical protein [Candidatus Binatia bacterium]
MRVHPTREVGAAFWRGGHALVRAGERVDRVRRAIAECLREAAQEAQQRRVLATQREASVRLT